MLFLNNLMAAKQAQQNSSPLKSIEKQKCTRIGYVYSRELVQQCDRVPNLHGRASLTQSLIEAYGLINDLTIIDPDRVNEEVLKGFHSSDYLDYIKGDIDVDDDGGDNQEAEEYGLGYDCPALEKLNDFVTVIAGASVAGAKALVIDSVDVAINFFGGWHHAQRDHASGFCYVNDCVLAILELGKRFKRVLYIDIDIHHGDGVENAFAFSKKVFTLSFHKCEEGYFPGTGTVNDVGLGRGRYYACNVPLKDGTNDETFTLVFQRVVEEVMERFRPEAIVCQCGTDGLVNDPLGTFNLTPSAYVSCVRKLLSHKVPTLFLGGGGYHKPNAARCFAAMLAEVRGIRLAGDIPEHDLFHRYGPSFELDISRGLRRDENTPEYVRILMEQVLGNLAQVSSEP